ncbi:hypothetical protein SteCoe_7227 [Stentor coeruleus]|uniref:Uncharacterized protein n=1 Tax=Stentor coeruleus TaxID=5963 RepID=A0A1R2CNA4_9CILI|nr:hypothetical protein SteCoe_7227 [Stentor coeruleus]
MQTKTKVSEFTIKHMEPIKIRKVRVSSRKIKKPPSYKDYKYSTEHRISTQNPLNRVQTSRDSLPINKINFSNTLSENEAFANIQEIHENPENEEDSVILTLSELLSQSIHEKTNPHAKAITKKPPLTNIKIKLKEKIIPVKTERSIPRALSHRVLIN